MKATLPLFFMICAVAFSIDLMGQVGGQLPSDNNLRGNEYEKRNKVELYPNPSTDFIYVEIKNADLVRPQFEMHSLIGNSIQVRAEEVDDFVYRIPVKSLPTGYYFIIVKDDYTRFKQAFKFLKR